jgi:hypothetical protein
MYGASSANFGNTSTGALYGAGRFTYSTNQFSSSLSSSTAAFTSASATWAELNFNSDFSASALSGNITRVAVPTSSISSDIDGLGVRGFFLLSGSNVVAADNLNEFAYVSGSTTGTSVVFYINKKTNLSI